TARFSAVLSSRSDSVRKVQPRTGTCISPCDHVSLDNADHVERGSAPIIRALMMISALMIGAQQ
ncbi:unnamed protein product, partial [Staurois parvus]